MRRRHETEAAMMYQAGILILIAASNLAAGAVVGTKCARKGDNMAKAVWKSALISMMATLGLAFVGPVLLGPFFGASFSESLAVGLMTVLLLFSVLLLMAVPAVLATVVSFVIEKKFRSKTPWIIYPGADQSLPKR